jgi:uncharacterized membrane protein
MWKMIAPLILIVAANCFYNICTKSVPGNMNTFGALTVTYLVAAVLSATLFVAGVGPAQVPTEIGKVNWAPFVLGLAIVGLEAGFVLLYRAGWPISTGALTANILLAVALLVIGILVYQEAVSAKQLIGIVVCAIGLFLVSS